MCDWYDVDCDDKGIHDEGGGYVIGKFENDCDWCDVDCDDEEIDDDIDSGTVGMQACDEIVVLEGVINDDVDTKETCDVNTCDEIMGNDDGVDAGKETCDVAGACDEACCVFAMLSSGGLFGTSVANHLSNPFQCFV